MDRRTFLALATVAALATAGGGQAKAPSDGILVCGAGACSQLSQQDALYVPLSGGSTTEPTALSTYYVVRWQWPGQEEQTAYYIRSAQVLRVVIEDEAIWIGLGTGGEQVLSHVTNGLQPFKPPHLTRVTIGRKVARRPDTYARLFRGAFVASTPGAYGWIPVRMRGDRPSPWSDDFTHVRISRRAAYVRIDGSDFRLPSRIARLARQRLPLR